MINKILFIQFFNFTLYFKVICMDRNIEDLKHIRSMMERSTKFLSLSGISGIVAGTIALIGSAFVYLILYMHKLSITNNEILDVFIIAVLVLGIAMLGGLYFSWKKAKNMKQHFWSNVTKQMIIDAGIPLVVGGIFSLILFYNNVYFLIASAMLLFCGMACVNAGARSYSDVKVLGVCLIILGILAGVWSQYGLLFWTIGFGFLFIIYGIVMYRKYDVRSTKKD